jgi:hypothetical protein
MLSAKASLRCLCQCQCHSVLVMWFTNMVGHNILVVVGSMFTQPASRLVVNIHCIIFVGLPTLLQSFVVLDSC